MEFPKNPEDGMAIRRITSIPASEDIIIPFNKQSIIPLIDTSTDTKFCKIKAQISEAKEPLDHIESNIFTGLMTSIDPYVTLRRKIKQMYDAQVVTNASLKIYEMITQMELVPEKYLGNFNVFCNAELPGAFIMIINHYFRTMRTDIEYEWVGSSYEPQMADRKSVV